ncbi:MAG TPA: hypothetical protein VNI36_02985 [Candidatus Dormibacteraeota bacterium]|nr:hypothetical protein [Candidatus Dormibacteraeota bacterium]
MNIKKIVLAGIAVALLGALPQTSRAGSLGPDILGLFPKETGEMAYADLKTARQFPWYAQLKEQMLPPKFREFETFLSSAGIDPNTQVTELAWALVPGKLSTNKAGISVPTADQVVGIALGQFQPASAEAYFTAKKLPIVKVRTFSLFAFGGGSGPNDLFFFFIDSNTAAFGQRQLLEKLIGVRYGEAQGLYANTDFSALVDQANGSGTVWAVLNPGYTRLAMQQLVPETSQFPAAAQLASKLKAMTISIQAGSGIDATFEAVCGSTNDANTFAALLQAGLMYRKYQLGNKNPDLGQLLDSAQITPAGDRLDLKISLTDDQMQSLIRNNTFAVALQ